ncbi:MAG TPA: glycosyltransferase [Thermoanaerobaculia bacterium]|nr:glycosyltransferase [Thermoanaerobaculia bacterium]
MIVTRVIRAEGLASAARRARERIEETLRDLAMRAGRAPYERADVLNLSTAPLAPRFGGVQVQLRARLRYERTLRHVALLHPHALDLGDHRRRLDGDFETRLRRALELTGAKAIHLENTADAPLDLLLRCKVPLIASIHDFSLFCADPHLLEHGTFCHYSRDIVRCTACHGEQRTRRARSREFLQRATALVFPSRFLLERHRELFDLPLPHAQVIEPGLSTSAPRASRGTAIAYVGAVKRHKGGHLIPQLVRDDAQWHVFGGGDGTLLRSLRQLRNVTIHGYYRDGALPALLARHRIGLTVIPSIWPETHSLVLTESWLAGVPAMAFDLGAIAERIRAHGGGWLTPLDGGADGLASLLAQWRAGALTTNIPATLPDARDAARAHIALYRSVVE